MFVERSGSGTANGAKDTGSTLVDSQSVSAVRVTCTSCTAGNTEKDSQSARHGSGRLTHRQLGMPRCLLVSIVAADALVLSTRASAATILIQCQMYHVSFIRSSYF